MCTGKFQFRKPGAVEQNQRTEKFGRPPPVFFRTSILPYDQQGAQETSKRETAEIQGGFCFEGTEVVVTYDFGSLEHAVAARPAAVTAAHTPKSARRVAIDPYRLIVQQDSPVGANALVDGGVNGHRSKWSVANGLGGARPPDRSRALPTMRRGGDRLKTSVKHTANVHGDPVSVGRGTRWVCHRYWSNFRFRFWPRFGAKSR